MTAYANFTQNFSVCQQGSCSQLIITDTSTGFGAGVGQLALGNLRGVDITVTRYSSDGTVDTTDSFSNSYATGFTYQTELVYELSDTDSGTMWFGEINMDDGYVEILIEYYDDSGNIVNTGKTISVFMKCNIECCINNMIPKIADHYNCNHCDEDYVDLALTAYGLYQSLCSLSACGEYTKAYEILEDLQNICEDSDCNCN